MFGYICSDEHYDWWVRRKEKGKSSIIISQEEFEMVKGEKRVVWIRQHEVDYVLSIYCECPNTVKETARRIKEQLRKSS